MAETRGLTGIVVWKRSDDTHWHFFPRDWHEMALRSRYARKGYTRTSDGRWASKPRHMAAMSKYEFAPGSRAPGKRCPDKTYVKRYGKSKGWCANSKEKARRIPCSFMTPKGRKASKRCKKKRKDRRAARRRPKEVDDAVPY